ncbi:MAG: GGDEF domain-containing protein [Candidatus Aminicenantes bacterium]|nr:GGDEF domain-containing protein [Candidatus Aminicenantes bacterium]
MTEKILLISESEEDNKRFNDILGVEQYNITRVPFDGKIEEILSKNILPLILADFDLTGKRADLFYNLQQGASKACIIFYGSSITSEELGLILHKGIYAFIPKKLLAERLKETILGGLENRRAFIEILRMMDDLKELNSNLEEEKESLKKRNQQLSFLNHLSREISYDFNWDRILQRMIDAGIEKTAEYSLFGLLFMIGARWNLALHMEKARNIAIRDEIVSNIIERVNSDHGHNISAFNTDTTIIPMRSVCTESAHDIDIIPLSLAGQLLGYMIYKAGDQKKSTEETEVILNTIANMLSLSLKNAQEYFRLKEAAVTDNLTGVYNRKGLFEFLERELPRAERYKKPMSFVIADMDDFKKINDSMGHQAGDYVLRETASILKKSFRQPDIVSRFGGDEFSILLPETELSDAHSIMMRVMEYLENHTFEWNDTRFQLRMSYGISNSNELKEQNSPEELIRLADLRLYDDKAH